MLPFVKYVTAKSSIDSVNDSMKPDIMPERISGITTRLSA